MFLNYNQGEEDITADLSKEIVIGVDVQRGQGVSSFDIAHADYKVYRDGEFVGSKRNGGPCNLETITFTPHGNSTHTECLGHISLSPYYVHDCIEDQFQLARLVSLSPNASDGSLDFSSMDWVRLKECSALVIRSLPNDLSKKSRNYSGENAPFISTNDMKRIVECGIKHLIIDLPSVDPEWDGGALAAHHIFWNYPESPRTECSITEFAYIDSTVTDGRYILKLNISPFVSDAAPSRPVLYPIIAR
ncbi:MAG: cyclase family protein [Bacteroidia bacterium]